ncbi:MAG: tetratricopeptide repeat protein [Candidatus Marinimicrobia bacterium]|nr:tetratricopeptide repeat protein [Candidatus Neomarinimicrobiota bacterium]
MLTPKKKFTKKELKHDPLLDSLEKGKEIYEEYNKQIITGVVALTVILLLAWGWMNSRETAKNTAMLENTKVTLAASQDLDDNVMAELERVVTEYGNNSNTNQATFQLAIARMDRGDHAGARDLFTQLTKSSDKQTKIAGMLKLAYLNERGKNFSDAAILYGQVAEMDAGTVSRYAKLQSGYTYLAAGDAQQAGVVVSALLDEEPTGKFKEYVKYLEGEVLEK